MKRNAKSAVRPKRITLSKKSAANPKSVAAVLAEFNRWRRAEGCYDWSEVPIKNVSLPYTETELGLWIDAAVSLLNAGTGKNDE